VCDSNPLAVHTSYRRLLLAETTPPFTLWQADGIQPKHSLNPEFSIEPSGLSLSVKLEAVGHATESPAGFPENIVVWEVDWEHDDLVFRSHSHAVRDYRKPDLSLELKREYPAPGRYHVAVRAIDAAGNAGIASAPIDLAID
jgi:hypothetical protein